MKLKKILQLSALLVVLFLIPSIVVLASASRSADNASRLVRISNGSESNLTDLDQAQSVNRLRQCILLVDDDNNSPDVRSLYTDALDTLGYPYTVFDVEGGDGDGPDDAYMNGYKMVIWFSGDKVGDSAGPNATDEGYLEDYLDAGGNLFLSSQDYLADFGLTTFGENYLGIDAFEDNQGAATTKYGSPGDPIGNDLGPYQLSYPDQFINNRGDLLDVSPGTSIAFRNSPGGNILDIDKDGGNWKTVFFGTSWVLVNDYSTANGAELLGRIVEWFGGCEAQIELTKTVGTDPNTCAETDSIDIDPGIEVTYCYEVTNTGELPFTLHNLMDSELGIILDDEPYELSPDASWQITRTVPIESDTVNTATWTAYVEAGGEFAVDSDSASVNVLLPEIELSKTVGTDTNTCASTDSITVPAGSEVTYCYEVTNTGDFTLNLHYLVDSELGDLLDSVVYELLPDASTFITQTTTIMTDTVNTAIWTAYIEEGGDSITANDSASVTVLRPEIELSKTVGTDPNNCATNNSITVPAGSEVTYCYEVTNMGDFTLNLHYLVDSELGALLDGVVYELLPGASTFITQTTTIMTDTVNTATWTAFVEADGLSAWDDASATVLIGPEKHWYFLPIIFKD